MNELEELQRRLARLARLRRVMGWLGLVLSAFYFAEFMSDPGVTNNAWQLDIACSVFWAISAAINFGRVGDH